MSQKRYISLPGERVEIKELKKPGATITTNRSAIGKNAMVSAAKSEAAHVGADVLEGGGNAFDAAVAVGFALGVCEPNASGLGGGGFMTAYAAKENREVFLDFREVAPISANPDMWEIDAKGEAAGNQKEQGGKSVCVPGEPAGLCYIQARYGTLPLNELVKPAILLARKGVLVDAQLKSDMEENSPKLSSYCEEGNAFLAPYEIGDKLTNIPLANTMEIIGREGAPGFYQGEIARQIVESVNRFGGDFTMEDLGSYRVQELSPIRGNYRGYEILSSPPPSSGGTHVIQLLNLLESFALHSMDFHSDRHLHLLNEVFKMCFADRARYMGDPAYIKLPLRGLLSKEYAAARAQEIAYGAVKNLECGDPFWYEPADTTHFSIADRWGNMVSITKTISSFFGSGIVPKNTGVILNSQMRGFALGKGKSNSVSGGKKPLSSMSPTIVRKDGRPYAVLGSPGGNRIITTVAQILSNLIDFDMDIESAVNAPRVFCDTENVFYYEDRIDPAGIEALKSMGQAVKQLGSWDRFVGGVHAIQIGKDMTMIGTADPRRNGRAVGLSAGRA